MKRLTLIATAVLALANAPAYADLTPVAGLEIENYRQLTKDVTSTFMAAGNPGMGMMVTPMLSGLLCAPNMQGIDLEKPIRGVLLFPDTQNEQPQFALILPLAGDGSAYLSAVRSAFQQSTKEGGIHDFREPNPNTQLKWPRAAVKRVKGHAIVAAKSEAVAVVEKLMLSNTMPRYPRISGTARLTLDLVKLVPIIEALSAQSNAAMAEMMPPVEEGQMDPMAVNKLNIEMIMGLLKQFRSYSIGLKGGSEGLTLYARLDHLPDTAVAEVFGKMKPPSDEFKRLVLPGTLVGMVGSGMDGYDIWAEPYAKHMTTMYNAMGTEMAAMGTAASTMMTESKGLYGSDYVIGIMPAPTGDGVSFYEIFELAGDRDIMAYMEKTLAMAQKLYAEAVPGLKIATAAAEAVDGVPVKAISYEMGDLTKEARMAMGPWSGMMDSFRGEYAVIGNKLVFAMGEPGVIAPIIRHIKKADAPSEFEGQLRTVFPQLKGEPVAMMHLSLVELVNKLMSTGEYKLPPEVLAMVPKQSDGIGLVQLKTPSAVFSAFRITGSEARGLMLVGQSAATAIQQIFMKGIQEQMNQAVMEMEMDAVELELEEIPPAPRNEDELPAE